MRTNNKGSAKAIKVLNQIGFQEITNISMKDLLSGFDIILIEESLQNADGKIIRGKNRTIIKVNSDIQYQEKKRFTIAHELGHYFLHDKIELHNDNSMTLNWFNLENQAKRGIEEYEANDFASELLMPERLLRQFILKKPFSPLLIKELSLRFKTSLTSVIYRLLSLSAYPLLVVFTHNGLVNYWKKTSDMYGWVKPNKAKPPSDSVALEYIEEDYEYLYRGLEKAQVISKSTWFELKENEADIDMYEYCIPMKQYKSIISVIWAD